MNGARFRLDQYDAVVDAAFSDWIARLPRGFRRAALELPHRLGHSPVGCWRSWREVFPTAAVRALPGLVAEGFPEVIAERRDDLWIAYLLIWLIALVDDAMMDAQAGFTRETNLLRRALDTELQARLARAIGRDAYLGRVIRRTFRDYVVGHHDEAIRWATPPQPASRARFVRETVRKAAPAFVPIIALGRLGGAPPPVLVRLRHLTEHFFLALQYRDDLTDWEEDFRAGRRTYFIECHLKPGDPPVRSAAELHRRVATGTVTEEFLRRAASHYRACVRIGQRLALPTLQRMAATQAATMQAGADRLRATQRALHTRFAAALQQRWAISGETTQ